MDNIYHIDPTSSQLDELVSDEPNGCIYLWSGDLVEDKSEFVEIFLKIAAIQRGDRDGKDT